MPSIFNNFRHAFRGLKIVFRTEKTFRILFIVALLVLAAAFYLEVADNLLAALLLIITLILSLEIFNSAVERLVDILAPKTHGLAKEIKDLLAAAVLLVSIFSILVGLVIFL